MSLATWGHTYLHVYRHVYSRDNGTTRLWFAGAVIFSPTRDIRGDITGNSGENQRERHPSAVGETLVRGEFGAGNVGRKRVTPEELDTGERVGEDSSGATGLSAFLNPSFSRSPSCFAAPSRNGVTFATTMLRTWG